MYNKEKTGEMMASGFWPVTEDGKSKMATAKGNLDHRPDLWQRFGLKNPQLRGDPQGLIYVFSPE